MSATNNTLSQALDEIFALPIRKLTVSNPDGGAQYKTKQLANRVDDAHDGKRPCVRPDSSHMISPI